MGRGHAGQVDIAGGGGEGRIRGSGRGRGDSIALLGGDLGSMSGVEARDVLGVAEVGGGEKRGAVGQAEALGEVGWAQVAGILAGIWGQSI